MVSSCEGLQQLVYNLYTTFDVFLLLDRDLLSSLTSMLLKSGHGSLLSKIVSTSTFEQETTIKKWICELENLQVNINMNLFFFFFENQQLL